MDGSGLLSHTFKTLFPNNRVIWNDFDDYQGRLKKYDRTVETVNEILEYVVPDLGYCTPNFKPKFLPHHVEFFKNIIEERKDEIDLLTIHTKFRFRGSVSVSVDFDFTRDSYYVALAKPMKKEDISGYLKGVERVQMDFKDLYDEYKDKKVLFLADPPYINTINDSYHGEFSIINTIKLVMMMQKSNGIFFTSTTSGAYEFIDVDEEYLGLKKGTFDIKPYKSVINKTEVACFNISKDIIKNNKGESEEE